VRVDIDVEGTVEAMNQRLRNSPPRCVVIAGGFNQTTRNRSIGDAQHLPHHSRISCASGTIPCISVSSITVRAFLFRRSRTPTKAQKRGNCRIIGLKCEISADSSSNSSEHYVDAQLGRFYELTILGGIAGKDVCSYHARVEKAQPRQSLEITILP
jgi:hypothetical protein